jgi:hypothetical protein
LPVFLDMLAEAEFHNSSLVASVTFVCATEAEDQFCNCWLSCHWDLIKGYFEGFPRNVVPRVAAPFSFLLYVFFQFGHVEALCNIACYF